MIAERLAGARRGLHPSFQKRRRIALAVLLVLVFAALLFVRAHDGAEDGIHESIEDFGIAAILLAILGRMWCTLYINGRKDVEVVREGPYSVSRNPLYFFSTIGAAGIGAMMGSAVAALLFAIGSYASFSYVIRVEERHLEQLFGEPYRAYLAEVPRFFPRLRGFRDSKTVTVRLSLLYRTLGDGLMFLLAYPFFEFVEHLQDSGILPVLLHIY